MAGGDLPVPCQLSGHLGGTPAMPPEPTPPLFTHNHQTSPSQHRQPGASRSPCLFLPASPALKMPPEPPAQHVPVLPVLLCPGRCLRCYTIPSATGPILGTARLERGAGQAGMEEEEEEKEEGGGGGGSVGSPAPAARAPAPARAPPQASELLSSSSGLFLHLQKPKMLCQGGAPRSCEGCKGGRVGWDTRRGSAIPGPGREVPGMETWPLTATQPRCVRGFSTGRSAGNSFMRSLGFLVVY